MQYENWDEFTEEELREEWGFDDDPELERIERKAHKKAKKSMERPGREDDKSHEQMLRELRKSTRVI